MYSETITVFNRHRANGVDTWYPTVLSGVDLNVDAAAMRAKYGAEAKDRAKLHIRFHDGPVVGDIYVGGKKYFLPKEWQTSDHSGITFQDGDLFDFFWNGAWAGGPVMDEDYTNGFFNYMKKTYDMVFVITSVARYDCIPHFEIVGA